MNCVLWAKQTLFFPVCLEYFTTAIETKLKRDLFITERDRPDAGERSCRWAGEGREEGRKKNWLEEDARARACFFSPNHSAKLTKSIFLTRWQPNQFQFVPLRLCLVTRQSELSKPDVNAVSSSCVGNNDNVPTWNPWRAPVCRDNVCLSLSSEQSA